MEKTVIMSGNEVYGTKSHEMEEIYFSSIIDEPDWHREGVGNGLLAENKDFGGA